MRNVRARKFLRGCDNGQLIHKREAIFNQLRVELYAGIRKGIQGIRNAAPDWPSDAENSLCISHLRVD